jgi:hypothetical protein
MIKQERLAQTILELTARRWPGRTICPSEVARAVGGDAWRALMPAVRDAARVLAAHGSIVVTQSGRVLAADAVWKGPIRLGLAVSPRGRGDT